VSLTREFRFSPLSHGADVLRRAYLRKAVVRGLMVVEHRVDWATLDDVFTVALVHPREEPEG
jgi:hypothetical protein